MMKKKTRVGLFLALIAIVAAGGALIGRAATNNDDPKQALIERLAYAHRAPIRFCGEIIVYQPPEDKTIKDEIIAEGRSMVPYLIKGLQHKKESICRECIVLLGDLPTKEGLAALIEVLDSRKPLEALAAAWLHQALHRLTGRDKPGGPKNVLRPDIDAMREIWLSWWAANKDKLVDTDTGIGLKNDDGTITPLPLPKQ
ncbi:MAG: hypothetical protein J6333_04730 [Planctomycetes bacterium]|nr:hypothetical protein [Planctomycetota bacterium]